jgi:hypothetical protein
MANTLASTTVALSLTEMRAAVITEGDEPYTNTVIRKHPNGRVRAAGTRPATDLVTSLVVNNTTAAAQTALTSYPDEDLEYRNILGIPAALAEVQSMEAQVSERFSQTEAGIYPSNNWRSSARRWREERKAMQMQREMGARDQRAGPHPEPERRGVSLAPPSPSP